MVLKSTFHQTRKNAPKMDKYLAKMKSLTDKLMLADAPFSTQDLILHTLTGLDSEYHVVVVKLVDQLYLTWVDIQSALLAFEWRIKHLNHLSSLTIQPTAIVAHDSDGDSRSNDFGCNLARGSSKRTLWRGRNFLGSRGRSRERKSGFLTGGRPYCHLCECLGHIVSYYYHCFDPSFNRPTHSLAHQNTRPP